MPALREFIDGPWRAVPVLGITQILSWGTIFYTPVLIVPLIAAERGWSMAFAMGGFSVGLLAAGLSAPYVGRSIDRFGGHVVMTAGSLIGALGLVLIGLASGRIAYLAVWVVLGIAMAANLYDSAFATLGRVFGAAARSPITALTLIGGFASTVSWPSTHILLEALGWRGTYLVYAALLAFISAPLHAWALPRERFEARVLPQGDAPAPAAVLPPYGLPFILVASAFATYAFVPSGLSANLLAIFARSGIDSGTVVWIGALFGPAQVGARLIEFAFGRNVHPLWVARFALSVLLCAFVMLAVLGFSVPVAAAFALMFGGANGLITITRGAVPLTLFGASGYGRLMGRLAGPFLLVQAAAPVVMAFVVDRASDPAALALAACFATAAL
ncbi:MAG: MFS transporter, partial [Devosia sp.]